MIWYDIIFCLFKNKFLFFFIETIIEKGKERYYNGGSKGKAAEYYLKNKEVSRENTKNNYRNLSEGENEAKREYGINKYRTMTEDEKNKLEEYQKQYQAAKQ